MTSPVQARRHLFFEAGGANLLSNFASLYTRAQQYRGLSLLENDDLSPCTSLPDEAILEEENGSGRGHDNLDEYFFPTEGLPLLKSPHSAQLRPSFGSLTYRPSVASGDGFVGGSTAPQTVFNAVNTLVGIAMLLLPYGFSLAGWGLGSVLLLTSAVITASTAKMLGQVLRIHPLAASYGDVARIYGGPGFQAAVTAIFCVDLMGASLLLVLLFSDSFVPLFPQLGSPAFKAVAAAGVFAMLFLPLSLLSLFSLFGIICTTALLVVVLACGLATSISPGLLLVPAETSFWPVSGAGFMLLLGIFMAPWGGHPVFPELYRDMRHSHKYPSCCNTAFSTTFALDTCMSVMGYLMFGVFVKDSLIKNLMASDAYSSYLAPTLCALMGLLAFSKLPLVARPIITVYEGLLGLNEAANKQDLSRNGAAVGRFFARLVFVLFLFGASLLFTSFGKIVAFLGSAICYTICMTLPLAFYLHFFHDELLVFKRSLLKVGITVGIVGAVAGTYASVMFEVAA